MKPTSEWLVLIRCAPTGAEAVRFQRWIQAHRNEGGLLFFQAEGVEHANAEYATEHLMNTHFRRVVCQGSWQRRFEQSPPEPFVEGSLIEFFSALEQPGLQLECFGVGATH